MKLKLPIEQQAKDETEKLKINWNTGPYNFLLQRTQDKYHLKANQKRRSQLKNQLGIDLPVITDQILQDLYKYACLKYMKKCNLQYGDCSGFYRTSAERRFLRTLQEIIHKNPKLKHLEIYPSEHQSLDLPPNFKMVVGNIVADYIVFGVKIKGHSAVAIEIDGDSHVYKSTKDELRHSHLKEMKIFTFEIQNDQVCDYEYLKSALISMYRLRNGSFNDQITRVKRSIWTKTICCHLSLSEIGDYVKSEYNIELNLLKEIEYLLKNQLTPRKIKYEIAFHGSKNYS